MAIIKKPVPAVVAKPVAKPVAGKPVTKPVTKSTGFEPVDMSTITLIPKSGGGGKTLSPFASKVYGLNHGTGFKITEEQYGENGKKLASLYAGAARRGIKLRVRRDTNGQLWLFRVDEETERVANEAKAQREAEKLEASQAQEE